MQGPKIVAANQSKKDVTAYGFQVTYLASKGCNVRGTSDAPYDFIEIERIDVSSDPGIYRGISPGQSAEHRFNVRPDEPFSFLSGDLAARFPLDLKTGYLHVL